MKMLIKSRDAELRMTNQLKIVVGEVAAFVCIIVSHSCYSPLIELEIKLISSKATQRFTYTL